jgi:hypothetical protein
VESYKHINIWIVIYFYIFPPALGIGRTTLLILAESLNIFTDGFCVRRIKNYLLSAPQNPESVVDLYSRLIASTRLNADTQVQETCDTVYTI